MNAERLIELRRVVEAAPEELFHMRSFSERQGCKTAYCAAGWAAIDPWFRDNTSIGDTFRMDPESELIESVSFSAFEDLRMIFDISILAARDLFGAELSGDTGSHAVTRAEVLQNIDRLLVGDVTEPYLAVCDDDDDDDDEGEGEADDD